MAVIHQKRAILIDCGLMFPESGMWGVDLVLPSIEFLITTDIKVEAIVLTHGHEDHIGAVPYVMGQIGYPKIIGTKFTLAMVKERIREHMKVKDSWFTEVRPPDTFKAGPFRIEAIQTTHSVVDSMGLVIETPVGKILHTGDFKIEEDPIEGRPFDSNRLEELGNEGIHLLLSDSTNVEREGWSRPEREVADNLKVVLGGIKKGKIVVALFASNIHRIQSLFDAAKTIERKIVLCGRSMIQNVSLACQHGYLHFDPSILIDMEDMRTLAPDRILILATGTQAEPRSALYRMSLNDHPHLKLNENDTVVFSSRNIPGNEKNISHMINNLYRRKANVIEASDAAIHASGHAYQEEQRKMFEWTKPKFFVPVHGEYRMLVKHKELAAKVSSKIISTVMENGNLVQVTKDKVKVINQIPYGKIFLDEASIDVSEEVLRDRRRLARRGLVVVSMVIDKKDAEPIEGPDFYIQGVNEDEIDLDNLRKLVLKHFHSLSQEARADDLEVEEELRLLTRRFFRKSLGSKPHVIPLIYEV